MTCPTVPTVVTRHDGRTTKHTPAVAVLLEGPTGRPVVGPVIWEGCEYFRTVRQAKRAAFYAWAEGEHLDDLAEAVEVAR